MEGRPGSLVVAEEAGERLDRVLHSRLPHLSRTAVQKLIEAGEVVVGGAPARAGTRLQAGDVVEWCEPAAPPTPERMAAEEMALDIRFEDEDLVVVNKPRGLVVHPAPGHATGTLANALLAMMGEDTSGEETGRPGIVHRLDRDTTGLMVAALSEQAMRCLQSQIAARTVERRYLALVRGTPRFQRALVDAPIGRHPTDRKRMAVIPPGSRHTHREARTELRVLELFPGFALLEARLETGRTHQVRVHCAYVGLPVCGDAVYGPRRMARDPHLPPDVREAMESLEGQALHAHLLAFDHPRTGDRLAFRTDPPPDFRRALLALGSTWSSKELPDWPAPSG